MISKTDSPKTRLLRTREAARYLGVGCKVIRALIISGDLPHIQMQRGNSPFLLDVRDLDCFIERRKNQNK